MLVYAWAESNWRYDDQSELFALGAGAATAGAFFWRDPPGTSPESLREIRPARRGRGRGQRLIPRPPGRGGERRIFGVNLVDFRDETKGTVYINPEHVAMVKAGDDGATHIVLTGVDGTPGGSICVQEDVRGVAAKLTRGKTSKKSTK